MKYIKANWVRYAKSASRTFLTFFVPVIIALWEKIDFNTLMTKSGLMALGFALFGLAVKALWETIGVYLIKLNKKLKK